MKKHRDSLVLVAAMFLSSLAAASPKFELEQLQGAWWSDINAPTAEFGIHGDQVWIDSDSGYHPCRIKGDILVFELGPGLIVKNRIIDLKGDHMVLESVITKERRSLIRVKQ